MEGVAIHCQGQANNLTTCCAGNYLSGNIQNDARNDPVFDLVLNIQPSMNGLFNMVTITVDLEIRSYSFRAR
jgi:hypothetical protein